ncbi:short chain dehydrogenase [Echinicola pacifica]|uniref:Short chain dehydrogenase n=1 Tax=Echinicola pacifica TaxID=346377 RepID=A0A918UJH2_9BACT|nr:short chain dehydrogenase [Echinicola pacifica]GGZ14670.1 short chain dehydrogenase [Echinicola pacifica]
MKIVIVGGEGIIGKALQDKLSDADELLIAGRSSGEYRVDFTDENSVSAFFSSIGMVDAVIVTAGSAPFKALEEMTTQDFEAGLKSKLMGQVNIALHAINNIRPGGSITLTSGVLAEDPIPSGAALSMVNQAVNGFVIGAYGELIKKGIRINAVSPALVEDSYEKLKDQFPGHIPAPMGEVAMAYLKSIKGIITGQIIKVGYNG